MSNFHLRDKRLGLKTKGLLSIMLSLPEDWDYTEKGLCTLTGEGKDSIKRCLKQMEQFGYLTRRQLRKAHGQMGGAEYIIYEIPNDPPMSGNPTSANPASENPLSERPLSENPPQLNTDTPNTKIQNTDPSIDPSEEISRDGRMDGPARQYQAYREILEENMGYTLFVKKREQLDLRLDQDDLTIEEYEQETAVYDPQKAEKVICYMLDILCSPSTADITINGDPVPREVVKSRLLKADHLQLKAVVNELNTNKTIKNPKAYAISMLYNG